MVVQQELQNATSQPEDEHSRLLEWAKEQRITRTGAAPARIPGKGLGVVAERCIKQGENIIFVPAAKLLAVNPNLDKPERDLPVELSIHGRLAVALVFPPSDRTQASKEWMAIMPSQAEMTEIMPANWSQHLQDLVPEAGQVLLQKQREKLENDVRLASQAFLPAIAVERGSTLAQLQDKYRYGWLLVNTRCFYWDYPTILAEAGTAGEPRRKKAGGRPVKPRKWPRDDCMALCPVIDYFNHADDDGCSVSYNKLGFTVTANRDYRPGEELTVSYGKHSNDFLLVEYGFTMRPNTSDYVALDSQILPRLSQSQQQLLKDENLLGNYTLFRATNVSTSTCHRTQCALRLLILPQRHWSRFVSGASDGEKEQGKVDKLCAEILQELLKDVGITISKLEGKNADEEQEGRAALKRRWLQIKDIVEHALGGAET